MLGSKYISPSPISSHPVPESRILTYDACTLQDCKGELTIGEVDGYTESSQYDSSSDTVELCTRHGSISCEISTSMQCLTLQKTSYKIC